MTSGPGPPEGEKYVIFGIIYIWKHLYKVNFKNMKFYKLWYIAKSLDMLIWFLIKNFVLKLWTIIHSFPSLCIRTQIFHTLHYFKWVKVSTTCSYQRDPDTIWDEIYFWFLCIKRFTCVFEMIHQNLIVISKVTSEIQRKTVFFIQRSSLIHLFVYT